MSWLSNGRTLRALECRLALRKAEVETAHADIVAIEADVAKLREAMGLPPTGAVHKTAEG